MTTKKIDRQLKIERLKQLKATADLELPSGLIVEVKRPPLATWMAAGDVPESIFRAAMSTTKHLPPATPSTEGEKDNPLADAMGFGLRIAHASIVWPRLVEGARPDNDDELDPAALTPDDIGAITEWAMGGSAGVPVQTTSGEVEVADVQSFRQDADVSSDSAGSRPLQGATVEHVGG